MFTDLVASTETLERLGDARWRDLLDKHDELIHRRIAASAGTVIRPTGDGVLASFHDAPSALRCAVELLQALAELGVPARAGLHTGRCERRGDDLAGLTVHVAARVLAEAAPGEVLITAAVASAAGRTAARLRHRGTRQLRGLSGRWELYAAEIDERV